VVNLNRGNINEGSLSTSGYDFGTHYRLPEFGFGKFTIGLDANYLASFNQQATSTSQVLGYAGHYNYPRVRANLGLDWSNGNWGATWAMRYFGAFRSRCWSQYVPAEGGDPAEPAVECNQPNYAATTWSGVGANRKGAAVYDDAQIRYAFPWKGTFAFGVKNVFDKSQTITYSVDDSSTAKVDPALPTDRYFYVSYNQKF
jgi:iron complex outermembrane receptor protein